MYVLMALHENSFLYVLLVYWLDYFSPMEMLLKSIVGGGVNHTLPTNILEFSMLHILAFENPWQSSVVS